MFESDSCLLLTSSLSEMSTKKTPTSDSQKTPLKQDTETTPLHYATLNTETPPNSASISGLLKTKTLIILFPGAFFRHIQHTVAPVKDATSALKKNF